MTEKDKILETNYLNDTLSTLQDFVSKGETNVVKMEEEFKVENEQYLNTLKSLSLNEMSEETAVVVEGLQRGLDHKLNELNLIKSETAIYKTMLPNPYFAKIDIVPSDTNQKEKYYLGVHTLEEDEKFIILDWRSPIASVFYDYPVGPAKIITDSTSLDVELINKRQFKIEDSKLKYFFDTNVAIEDELLKDALGQNSSNSMKSIVQTIQQEQNNIIRSSENVTLVVNGVAGSGKTAIGLHRIAYLLYKLKGKLSSNSILLLSHNNAFSSYISSVLPELAEEDVKKQVLDFECYRKLKSIAPIEYKYEQMERVISSAEQAEIWRKKVSYKFLTSLTDYLNNVVANDFKPTSFSILGNLIEKEKIKNLYFEMYKKQNIFTRLKWISEALFESCFYNVKSKGVAKKIKIEIFEKLFSFVKQKKPLSIYLDFLKVNGLSMSLRNGKIKNEDAYAIWYIKMFVYGYESSGDIKHLVVDEMQEYSAIQLKIIDMLYPCTKTILGDVKQCVEYGGALDIYEHFSDIFSEQVEKVLLNKSYRSTKQITDLFKYLIDDNTIQSVDRLGDEVGFVKAEKSIFSKLVKLTRKNNKFASIAIITKTNKQAKFLYNKLNNHIDNLKLIGDNKELLSNGINIISAFNSKGLEFDYVIVYDASEENYSTSYEMNLLFIACSRAMHKLDLVTVNNFCNKIENYKK